MTPDQITPEWIAESRALAEKANLPWKTVGRDFAIKGFPQVEMNTPDGHYFPVNTPAVADYVVHAANSHLVLLDLVESLRAENERLRIDSDALVQLRAKIVTPDDWLVAYWEACERLKKEKP